MRTLLSFASALGTLGSAEAAGALSRVEAALDNISTLQRPGKVGYATFWDGNRYVQCRRMPDGQMRCEAAGTLLQPSLARIMSAERLERLRDLGWVLEPAFGNHVRVFPGDMRLPAIARAILRVLREAYDVRVDALEIATKWVDDVACPPRNGFTQNLAGLVNDAPSMRETAIRACTWEPASDPGVDEPEPGPPKASLPDVLFEEILTLYSDGMAAEIQRLRVNADQHVYAIFQAGEGYVQCMPDARSGVLYCEALSEESWPGLAELLTPERRAFLKARGYAEPGHSPNYSREYRFDSVDDKMIARDILAILYEVYGYRDESDLEVNTE